MPFIRITLSPAHPQAHAAIAADTTRLIAEILGKKAPLTAVLVEDVIGTWTIGGQTPPRAAHLEAVITAGTNSDAEKAAFLHAARIMLHRHCGTLPEATYAIVREVAASDWGYDGKTQASRR
ncbi:MAG: hypothetical protein FD176_2177 [Rhodospirillaceae bacterium]|nr:MAG: hypothetical protein FD176_2177 [Rhodospirillaceae bacterium]TNC95751.1 MAG: hypothetical protein FD119_2126 [Stygiobacter sp.]